MVRPWDLRQVQAIHPTFPPCLPTVTFPPSLLHYCTLLTSHSHHRACAGLHPAISSLDDFPFGSFLDIRGEHRLIPETTETINTQRLHSVAVRFLTLLAPSNHSVFLPHSTARDHPADLVPLSAYSFRDRRRTSPFSRYPDTHTHTMALKRINKELTDLGR